MFLRDGAACPVKKSWAFVSSIKGVSGTLSVDVDGVYSIVVLHLCRDCDFISYMD